MSKLEIPQPKATGRYRVKVTTFMDTSSKRTYRTVEVNAGDADHAAARATDLVLEDRTVQDCFANSSDAIAI